MQTKNGQIVENLRYFKEFKSYVGRVNGKLLTWDSKGRRASIRKSKLDLRLETKGYINLLKWGERIKVDPRIFSTEADAKRSRTSGIFKTIQVEI